MTKTTKLSITTTISNFIVIIFIANGCGHVAPSPTSRIGLMNERGVDLARSGLWEEAQFYWQRALALDPSNIKVLNNLAIVMERNGNYNEAERYYRKALGIDSDAATVRENLDALINMKDQVINKVGGDDDEAD